MQFNFFETALRAQKSYNRLMEPVCRKWSLTHNELDVLMFLANNPGQDRAVDIARGRGISKGHVSLSLRSLEERGLVTRREDGSDRRTVHLALTSAAGEIAKDGQEAQRYFFSRVNRGITPEESEIIWAVTRKIGENIRQLEREL
ncbi:MAG: MarR family winged helix-turn-helix transcriptional regulator [Faecousia sp.]